jgi:hypothetical protein
MAERELRPYERLRNGETTAPTAGAAPPHEYDDPKRQWEILNPETLRYPLDVAGGVHVIEVKTEFSINDLFHRRVLDDLESYSKFVYYKLAELSPESGARAGVEWVRSHPQYLDIILGKSDTKKMLCELLTKISRYVEPFSTKEWNAATGRDEIVVHRRPTVEQLSLGMESAQMSAAGLYMFNRWAAEVARKKAESQSGNGPAATTE